MNISLKACAAFLWYSPAQAEDTRCTRRGSILEGIINHLDLAGIEIHHHTCEIPILQQDQGTGSIFNLVFSWSQYFFLKE